MVKRPRHSSAGTSDAVRPLQKRTRRIGTARNTAPVERSVTCLRWRKPWGRAHRGEPHRVQLAPAVATTSSHVAHVAGSRRR